MVVFQLGFFEKNQNCFLRHSKEGITTTLYLKGLEIWNLNFFQFSVSVPETLIVKIYIWKQRQKRNFSGQQQVITHWENQLSSTQGRIPGRGSPGSGESHQPLGEQALIYTGEDPRERLTMVRWVLYNGTATNPMSDTLKYFVSDKHHNAIQTS